MAIDSGPCLSDLPGIPLLRAIETVWLEGPVIYVFVVFLIMLGCLAEHLIAAVIVIFYSGIYFVVFATRRPIAKALIIFFILTTAVQAFVEERQPTWLPSFTHSAGGSVK